MSHAMRPRTEGTMFIGKYWWAVFPSHKYGRSLFVSISSIRGMLMRSIFSPSSIRYKLACTRRHGSYYDSDRHPLLYLIDDKRRMHINHRHNLGFYCYGGKRFSDYGNIIYHRRIVEL